MSLLDKLRQSAVEQSVHVAPATNPIPKQPEPTAPRPEILGPAPAKKISRGRPRKAYQARDYEADVVRAVLLWAQARVLPCKGNAVPVGTMTTQYTMRTSTGKRVRYTPHYANVTLRDDFLQFCQQNKWPPMRVKHFSGLVLKYCTEHGIEAALDRSYRHRRAIIKGIILAGTPKWGGNEAYNPYADPNDNDYVPRKSG